MLSTVPRGTGDRSYGCRTERKMLLRRCRIACRTVSFDHPCLNPHQRASHPSRHQLPTGGDIRDQVRERDRVAGWGGVGVWWPSAAPVLRGGLRPPVRDFSLRQKVSETAHRSLLGLAHFYERVRSVLCYCLNPVGPAAWYDSIGHHPWSMAWGGDGCTDRRP